MEKSNRYCVYIHKNKKNGKVYVGQTSMIPEKRWGKNGSGYKYQTCFWNEICKYSWDNFSHEIIKENLSSQEADEMERELILKYNSTDYRYGYNLESGGTKNKYHSERTKQKISIITQERYLTDWNPRKKKVAQYDFGGNLIRVWDCAREAAKELGIQESGISECCNGDYDYTGNYIFRYVIDKNNIPIKIIGLTRIAQYDLNGVLIKVWDHPQQAADALKINYNGIVQCCNGKVNRFLNHIFKYVKNDEEIQTKIHGYRKYGQFDKDNNCIRIFNNLKEIKKELDIEPSGISKCCQGLLKTSGGYIWKYIY